ncbi:DUF7513 family protein [Halegenticoccus tardaugens]|uniref:DUF7513 family protein n=1 Tax=Halegenticoccus tardaugens TaxID=2071624 RepID=UPI00100A5FC9|nr:hypothetical protein [Halegenticoccus tardaugens]
MIGKFLAGWKFRTSTPAYEPGDELTAFVTGDRGGAAVVRVGDTIIRLPDADPSLVERRIELRVVEFDAKTHEGRGEVLRVLDGRE